LPLARNAWGYQVAFTIPAALMAVAFALFAAGRRHYPVENVRAAVLPVRAAASEGPRAAAATEGPTTAQALRRLSGVFGLIAVFWFVYDQSASTWIFFAKDHTDLALFPGVHLTPDQIQAINPLAIVLLTPLFNAMWSRVRVVDTRKMLFGFLIVVVAMGAMAAAGWLAGEGRVTVWWLVAATVVITLAELCVSVVGLEFAFREAGPRAKSAVTAVFLMTVFVGDTFGGVFDQLYDRIDAGSYFALQMGIILAAAAVFWRVARGFERRSTDPLSGEPRTVHHATPEGLRSPLPGA